MRAQGTLTCVARYAALVLPAWQGATTGGAARPRTPPTAPALNAAPSTVAWDAHHLGARGARARVAQQEAAVATGRLQLAVAHLPARVRHEPRVGPGVGLPAAPTVVHAGRLLPRVLVTALGAVPGRVDSREVLWGERGGHSEASAVPSPLLHTRQVEHAVASHAAPHGVCALHAADAHETGERPRLQTLLKQLPRPLQHNRPLRACLPCVLAERRVQDSVALRFLNVVILIVVIIIRGGGPVAIAGEFSGGRLVGELSLVESLLG